MRAHPQGIQRSGRLREGRASRRVRALSALLALVAAGSVAAVPAAVAATAPASAALMADPEIVHLGTEVTVTVDGDSRVARFEIQDRFRNAGGRLLEADYLYPMPPGAIFSNVSLFAGESELRGEVLPADEARGIYEEIVRRRKDPALVELLGSGLVRARVFPIEPGQERKVILRYQQVLPRDGGLLRLTYPRPRSTMVPVGAPEPVVRREPVGPPPWPMPLPGIRPVPVPAAEWSLRVRVTAAARFAEPFSPSHAIDVQRRGDELEILARAGAGAAASDLELLLPLVRDEIGATLLSHSPDPGREDGYFMLLVTPPPYTGGERIARDLTMVLDLSGSMLGHKIEQARGALRGLLRGLDPGDRFRLVTFASVVREMSAEALPATAENVRRAIEYLDGLAADGSTNIHDALVRALEPAADPERLSLVVFLTDGLPTVSETDPERIADAASRLRDGERVFAFGVGEDVNTYLLDRLAEGGRGSVSYVRPDEDVEAAVSALGRKIGTPALADLRIVQAPVALEELYPSVLPDLFHGEELVLLGRYREAGAGTLTIEGSRRGRAERLDFELAFAGREPGNDFVARLWAARKAGELTARIRLHGPDDESVEAIRELGLRYGILTEYTSYLVQEPGLGRLRPTELRDRIEPAAAPQEQTGAKAFRRARIDAQLSGAASLGVAEEALNAMTAAPGASGDAGGATWQRLGRRIFTWIDDAWRDLRVEESAPALVVEPYSAAWFELLERLPGLRAAAALGERVIIAGEGLTLRLEAGGQAALAAGDWKRLEDAFAAER